jgi:hypothetical protein
VLAGHPVHQVLAHSRAERFETSFEVSFVFAGDFCAQHRFSKFCAWRRLARGAMETRAVWFADRDWRFVSGSRGLHVSPRARTTERGTKTVRPIVTATRLRGSTAAVPEKAIGVRQALT